MIPRLSSGLCELKDEFLHLRHETPEKIYKLKKYFQQSIWIRKCLKRIFFKILKYADLL